MGDRKAPILGNSTGSCLVSETRQYSHLLQEVSPSRSIEAFMIVMYNTTQMFVLVSFLNLNDEHARENDGE